MTPVEIVRRPITHPDAEPILALLNHELQSTEPEGGICFIHVDPEEVEGDNGAFYIAYVDGVASACGAYRRIEPGVAEVKRMWVDPAQRGRRLGAAILRTLEDAVRAQGYTEMRLETGEHLTAAVSLYEGFGFRRCEPWGEYIDSPSSYCMSKAL